MPALNVCRSCLSSNVLLSPAPQSYVEEYILITSLSLKPLDGKPQGFCSECCYHLRRCHRFRVRCLQAEAVLNLLQVNDDALIENPNSETDQQSLKLVPELVISKLHFTDIAPANYCMESEETSNDSERTTMELKLQDNEDVTDDVNNVIMTMECDEIDEYPTEQTIEVDTVKNTSEKTVEANEIDINLPERTFDPIVLDKMSERTIEATHNKNDMNKTLVHNKCMNSTDETETEIISDFDDQLKNAEDHIYEVVIKDNVRDDEEFNINNDEDCVFNIKYNAVTEDVVMTNEALGHNDADTNDTNETHLESEDCNDDSTRDDGDMVSGTHVRINVGKNDTNKLPIQSDEDEEINVIDNDDDDIANPKAFDISIEVERMDRPAILHEGKEWMARDVTEKAFKWVKVPETPPVKKRQDLPLTNTKEVGACSAANEQNLAHSKKNTTESNKDLPRNKKIYPITKVSSGMITNTKKNAPKWISHEPKLGKNPNESESSNVPLNDEHNYTKRPLILHESEPALPLDSKLMRGKKSELKKVYASVNRTCFIKKVDILNKNLANVDTKPKIIKIKKRELGNLNVTNIRDQFHLKDPQLKEVPSETIATPKIIKIKGSELKHLDVATCVTNFSENIQKVNTTTPSLPRKPIIIKRTESRYLNVRLSKKDDDVSEKATTLNAQVPNTAINISNSHNSNNESLNEDDEKNSESNVIESVSEINKSEANLVAKETNLQRQECKPNTVSNMDLCIDVSPKIKSNNTTHYIEANAPNINKTPEKINDNVTKFKESPKASHSNNFLSNLEILSIAACKLRNPIDQDILEMTTLNPCENKQQTEENVSISTIKEEELIIPEDIPPIEPDLDDFHTDTSDDMQLVYSSEDEPPFDTEEDVEPISTSKVTLVMNMPEETQISEFSEDNGPFSKQEVAEEDNKVHMKNEEIIMNTLITIEVPKQDVGTKTAEYSENIDPRKNKNFVCDFCPKEFNTNKKCQQHMLTHMGLKQYSLRKTSKQMPHEKNKDIEKKRTLTEENIQESEETSKPVINMDIVKNDDPNDYRPNIDPNKKRRYFCDYCKKLFSKKIKCEQHIKTHMAPKAPEAIKKETKEPPKKREKRPYVMRVRKPMSNQRTCPICKKEFTSSHHCKVHIRTHTGEKPYQCLVCDKKFTRASCLKMHIRIHTKEYPFECYVCAKKFTMKANLNTHLRKHTGEQPYKCSICEKRCAYKGDLKCHMRIHTGEQPFHCTLCQERFTWSSSLKWHMRKFHAEAYDEWMTIKKSL